MRSSLILLAFCLGSLVHSTLVAQDKNKLREPRRVSFFSILNIGGATDVYLKIGTGYIVEVEATAKELPLIRVVNSGTILSITYEGNAVNWSLSDRVRKVFITCPSLESIIVHGSSSVKVLEGRLNAPKLALNAKGSSDMELAVDAGEVQANCRGSSKIVLRGKASILAANIQGSSDFRAKDLTCQKAFITAQGSSNAFVNASDEVVAYAKGSSDVHNVGAGKVVQGHAKGASDIHEHETGRTISRDSHNRRD